MAEEVHKVKVHIKVWTSDMKECETFVFPCANGQSFELMSRFVHHLKDKFPENEFQSVAIGAGRYNVFPVPPANA